MIFFVQNRKASSIYLFGCLYAGYWFTLAQISPTETKCTLTKPIGYCPSEKKGTVEASGVLFSWPETSVGSRATITCPLNFDIYVSRECLYQNKTLGKISWGPIRTNRCLPQNTRNKKIFLWSQERLSSDNVVCAAREIKNLTYPGKTLSAGDIANVATVLENIVAVKEKADQVVDDFLITVDNVLDANLTNVLQSQRQSNSSLRIVEGLNTFLESLTIDANRSFRKVLRNFVVDLTRVHPLSFSGLTFSGIVNNKADSALGNGSIAKNSSDTDTLVPAPTSTTIRLPRTLFNESIPNNLSASQIILLAFFKETKFFRVVSDDDTTETDFSKPLNSYVIAGSIVALPVTHLERPVQLVYSNIKAGNKNESLCSFWNFTLGNWSQDGCSFEGILQDGRIVCNCDHLTNFAVLMDIYPDEVTAHEEVLGLISYIGCGLSLVGLIFTIISILILKPLRSKIPGQILLNFCISLSLTLVVFLSSAERSKTSSLASCRAAAIALHYFVLVAFMWMAIEAFNMYLAFVKVLPSYVPKFILKCCIVAWGIPIVIVSITVGVALDQYGDNKYCRLHGVPFLVSFLAPVLCIVVGNCIAFVLIIRSLLTSGNKITSDRRATGFQQARQGAAILVLLGLTWLFGVLAINDAKIVFQYLFCIFNSLQGLLVFVFYCLLPPGIRKQYKSFFRRKVQTLSLKKTNPHLNIDRRQKERSFIELRSYLDTNSRKDTIESTSIMNSLPENKGRISTFENQAVEEQVCHETLRGTDAEDSKDVIEINSEGDKELESKFRAKKEITLTFLSPGTLPYTFRNQTHYSSMVEITLQNNLPP